MKIAYDFDRYGRYALDTSYIGDRLGGLKECDAWMRDFVTEMSEKVLSMVKTSLESLRSFDAMLARAITQTENEVDKMYFNYLDKLIQEAPAAGKCTISSVLVIRYLERIADHATYVCESVVYLSTGEKITLR
jgi:phosphate transport system protein